MKFTDSQNGINAEPLIGGHLNILKLNEQLLWWLPDSEEKEPGGRMFKESQGGLEWWREEGSGLDRRSELDRLPESVNRSKGYKVHCEWSFIAAIVVPLKYLS